MAPLPAADEIRKDLGGGGIGSLEELGWKSGAAKKDSTWQYTSRSGQVQMPLYLARSGAYPSLHNPNRKRRCHLSPNTIWKAFYLSTVALGRWKWDVRWNTNQGDVCKKGVNSNSHPTSQVPFRLPRNGQACSLCRPGPSGEPALLQEWLLTVTDIQSRWQPLRSTQSPFWEAHGMACWSHIRKPLTQRPWPLSWEH